MSDQPALDSSGKLKDASEIVWYNDKDDDTPIGAPLPDGLSHTGVLYTYHCVVFTDMLMCFSFRSWPLSQAH